MLLLAAVLLVQGGWRPTVDNITSFPKDLKPAGRAAALARLDPILPILKAALTTDAVEFQPQRSFDNDPWVPGWPWPRDISVFGYEAMAGGYEGEAATIITVFANDLDPVLMPVLDHPPTYVIRHQHVIMLRRDSTVPWKPISQREFGRRLRDELRRRATHDYQARVALGRLNADFASLTDATMLLPEQYDPSAALRRLLQ